LDYLQMLTEPATKSGEGRQGKEQVEMEAKREQVFVGLFVIVAVGVAGRHGVLALRRFCRTGAPLSRQVPQRGGTGARRDRPL